MQGPIMWLSKREKMDKYIIEDNGKFYINVNLTS